MIDSPECSKRIQIQVNLGVKNLIFDTTQTRPYKFEGVVEEETINYSNTFSFVDLKNLEKITEFEYQFLFDKKPVGKVYKFKSRVVLG